MAWLRALIRQLPGLRLSGRRGRRLMVRAPGCRKTRVPGWGDPSSGVRRCGRSVRRNRIVGDSIRIGRRCGDTSLMSFATPGWCQRRWRAARDPPRGRKQAAEKASPDARRQLDQTVRGLVACGVPSSVTGAFCCAPPSGRPPAAERGEGGWRRSSRTTAAQEPAHER